MAEPTIKIKRSSVAGKIPTIDNLSLGELAINTYDGKIFLEQDQGGVGVGTTIAIVNPWNVGLGSTAYNLNFTAGSVGIGTTDPLDKLTVSGRIQIQQDSGSNNRLVFRGQPESSYRWSIDNYSSSNEFRIFREEDFDASLGFVAVSISTIGTVSATKFVGDGSGLTNLPGGGGGGGESYWASTSAGIHTLSNVGIGTTNPTSALTVKGNTSLETLNVSGVSTFQNDTYFQDSTHHDTSPVRAYFGSLDEMSIYSTGTYLGNSYNYIDASSGYLDIRNLRTTIRNPETTTQRDLAIFDATTFNSEFVKLYYGGNEKFETIGAGVTITGTTFTNQLSVSGVATANSFDGDGSSLTNLNATNLTSGIVPAARITNTSALSVGGDLYVSGNISFGGTTTQLNTTQVTFSDPDIVLGVGTTSTFNPTDSTANHGGVAVASTEGYPLVNLNIVPAETLPTTYKKFMWFKNNAAGLGTDAWLSNYAIGIGSTQFPSGTVFASGSIQFTQSDINVVSNINSSGIITSNSINVGNVNSSGIVTAISFVGSAQVGVATGGVYLGLTTQFNFVGSGITVTPSYDSVSGITTLTFSGGSGGGGGVTVTDDTSTNATRYILFDDATSGTVSAINVSSTKLTFNPSTGNFTAGGTVTASSDIKLKTNIKTLTNSLGKVLNLRGVEYDRIDIGGHHIGVVAQEVEEIIPEVVCENNGIKSVAYANIVAVLIEAIKEQQEQINNLEHQLIELKK